MTWLQEGLSWFLRPLLYLFTAYVIFALFLYLLQDKLLFLPDRTPIATPKDYGLFYEELYFVTTDNVKLHGWFIPSDREISTVINKKNPKRQCSYF